MSSKSAWAAVKYVGLGVFLTGTLLVRATGEAGILDASWTAPTTNTDGTPLTDLASYRVYYGPSSSPCPGSSFAQVPSPMPNPGPGQTLSYRLSGLATGTLYNVAVSAVDAVGNQSACSSIATAVARTDFAVTPSGTVNFGSINLGSFTDKVVTVSNTGGGTVSGSASVPTPFSIVSGSPFTLSGVGATQAVTVRFTPPTTTTVSATINFIANGGTISGIMTGSGTSTTDTTAPSVIIAAPTAGASVTGTVTVSANATDNIGVVGVQFQLDGANLGPELITAPYTVAWNTMAAANGNRVLTAVARDAAGNRRTSVGTTVTVANTGPLDVTAPVTSQMTLTGISSSNATITWTTNKASDTQVEYGPTKNYGSFTPLDTTLVTSHSQVLSGLLPHTWYHFRVRSRDAAGNLVVSRDSRFRTPRR